MLTSTKYTVNNFSSQHFQMCFAGPSMGNSADVDQMSPDVALHLGLQALKYLKIGTCPASQKLLA